jgi:hypothetical protein
MIPRAVMPVPTSKASDARAITEVGPPVSGSADALAEAEAETEALALAADRIPSQTVPLSVWSQE